MAAITCAPPRLSVARWADWTHGRRERTRDAWPRVETKLRRQEGRQPRIKPCCCPGCVFPPPYIQRDGQKQTANSFTAALDKSSLYGETIRLSSLHPVRLHTRCLPFGLSCGIPQKDASCPRPRCFCTRTSETNHLAPCVLLRRPQLTNPPLTDRRPVLQERDTG